MNQPVTAGHSGAALAGSAGAPRLRASPPSPGPVPALLLGSGITALGVIRALARAGIPALVWTQSTDIARRSRWFRPAPAGSVDPRADLEGYLVGSGLERAVLFAGSDTWAERVARMDATLARRFPGTTAPATVLDRLLDKARLAETLEAARLPHPRTEPVRSAADVERLDDRLFETAFLKPCDSQRFFQRFGVKAVRVRDRADAVQRLGEIGRHGLDVVLQEYVPGPPSNHVFIDGFVDADGRIAALLARRRLRMYPPDFGNSTYMVTVAPDEVTGAVATVKRLVAAVGYRGIFSAELKQDARDGVFKLLETNVRPWWYVDFAARCGVNVCALAYRDALGLPIESIRDYTVGRSCCYPYYDFYACRELWRRRELSLGAWARSWAGAEQPVFRWTDPRPALTEFGGMLRRKLWGRST
ncbi:MAG TPA: hypothetical protein VF188_05530 [Longimicrobiales bacterium]